MSTRRTPVQTITVPDEPKKPSEDMSLAEFESALRAMTFDELRTGLRLASRPGRPEGPAAGIKRELAARILSGNYGPRSS